jgi:hypothetical protein
MISVQTILQILCPRIIQGFIVVHSFYVTCLILMFSKMELGIHIFSPLKVYFESNVLEEYLIESTGTQGGTVGFQRSPSILTQKWQEEVTAGQE